MQSADASPTKRLCAWCSKPRDGRNPFYCEACVKLHWSKALPLPPTPVEPNTPEAAKPRAVIKNYAGDKISEQRYPT